MNYGDLLLYFGWAVIFGSIAAVFIPYLFFNQPLMTFRNALLGGCIPFVGSSSIALYSNTQEMYGGAYLDSDYREFMYIFVAFIATFLIGYQFYKPPKITTKLLEDRPRYADSLPVVFAIVAVIFGFANVAIAQGLAIPVVSQVIVKIGPASSAFAAVFAIGSWLRDRTNPLKLTLMLVVLGFSLILAVMSGGGRRNFLAVIITLPLLVYWESLQNVSRIRTTVVIAISGVIAFVVLSAYNEVRHFDRGRNAESEERDFETSAEAILKVPAQILKIQETLESEQFHNTFGQNATNCSLYVISKNRKGGANQRVRDVPFPYPFHSLYFVACNPIPRQFWEDKPESLGYILTKDYNEAFRQNWGPGIVGHVVFEGGYMIAVFYGLFFAVFLKTFDTALINNHFDLFLLGLIAAAMPQVIMLVRGDIGIVMLNFIFVFIYYLLVKFIALRIYGRPPTYTIKKVPQPR